MFSHGLNEKQYLNNGISITYRAYISSFLHHFLAKKIPTSPKRFSFFVQHNLHCSAFLLIILANFHGRDCLQRLLLISSKFKRTNYNFYSCSNHQKTYDFLMIKEGIKVN